MAAARVGVTTTTKSGSSIGAATFSTRTATGLGCTSTRASSWYQNVNPWKDKTISGARNIYGKEGISWYTVFRHVHCYSEDVEIYGCNYHTKYREQENSVFN